jgi:outer membrane receptor protein involved in Fe transport
MLKKLLLTFSIVLTFSAYTIAQTGTLQGTITDQETGEPIPFANIVAEVGGTQVGGATSDFDGKYVIRPIDPGRYDIKATYVGYRPLVIQNVVVSANQIRFLDVAMEPSAIALEEFEVREYAVPLIDKDQTSSGATVTAEEIAKMPNRSANAIAVSVGGVFSADGERGSVRGQRQEGTIMYIDGIRVRGSSALPEAAIEQVSVILGGVPAQYGDAVGGIINVTTRGPSRAFGAGAEIETSQFLDAYGYNRASLNMQGPLIKGRDKQTSLLGYFVAGEFLFREDGRPTSTGVYKAKDDILADLEKNPITPSASGTGSFYKAEFIRKSDMDFLKATQNTNRMDVNVSGKIDVRTTPNVNLSFGGSYNYTDRNNFSFTNSVFNYKNNAQITDNTWRVYGRLTHRFPTEGESRAFVRNVYYTLQADYSVYNYVQQDERHQDDFFKYGYLGSFTRHMLRSYETGTDDATGMSGYIHNAYLDTLYQFQRAEYNSVLANYTQQYYDLREGNIRRFEDMVPTQGGLVNGRGPDAVYSLMGNAGALQTGYLKLESQQLGINALFSAYLGNHEIRLGLQYEQRFDRAFSIGPTGLWGVMRGLTNFHIEQLDKNNPELVYLNGVFMDTINYPRLFDEGSQRAFDYNLRRGLGLDTDGLDYLLIDSYDFNTNSLTYYDRDMVKRTITLEDGLNLDMFSADELLNQGNELVTYYGFDHTGKKLTGNPSLTDFFNETDADGNSLRHIGAFQPIYSAFYIQDKFAFRDLIFNIGVRVDRFDANQSILKDPYVLAEAWTIGEDANADVPKFAGQHPSNMGEEFVIYVDQPDNPATITGYRSGDTWFTAGGLEIDGDPTVAIGQESGPYLKTDGLTIGSFQDYEPQWTVMPRISFSFPISDDALFFAHYNVLTQRPTTGARINLIDYFFLETRGTQMLNNPNLKPEKTIDYELGFQQKLTNSSSLAISGFYREIRDQIQSFRFTGAYPSTYYSYNNIDFGTVKGLTVTYDLRRTNNARIRASYTLQFANGTGSNPETARALIQSGQPNLRNLIPLDFDRRHAINLSLDYRFGSGSNYNGPSTTRTVKGTDQTKSINWLENTGFNMMIFGGSGTPYTKSSRIYQLGGARQIQGSINGARLPWQFRIDARLDRDINLRAAQEDGNTRNVYLNVYLRVNNVMDSKNIMGVYSATGNPDDDGFLAAAEYQNQIDAQLDPQAYRDLYSIRINSPFNYSLPRMIRLGVSLNF